MPLHSYCLSKNEYLQLIYWELFSEDIDVDIDVENLKKIIEDSSTYWDKQILGLNYFLSILTENLIKKGKFDSQLFDIVYNLKNQMYFEVEEFDYNFIEDLVLTKEPIHTRKLSLIRSQAIRDNNEELVEKIQMELLSALEDELIEICSHE